MSKLDFVLNNPQTFFSISYLSRALRVSRAGVIKWCKRKELKSILQKTEFGVNTRVIKGEWFAEYLKKLNEYPEVEGWKNLNQILGDYKLPNERK